MKIGHVETKAIFASAAEPKSVVPRRPLSHCWEWWLLPPDYIIFSPLHRPPNRPVLCWSSTSGGLSGIRSRRRRTVGRSQVRWVGGGVGGGERMEVKGCRVRQH